MVNFNGPVNRRQEAEYEVWEIQGDVRGHMDSGETVSNVLVDQTASGAGLDMRTHGGNWHIENVGFKGSGRAGDNARFQIQVGTGGGTGTVRNCYGTGYARSGQSSSGLGFSRVLKNHSGTVRFENCVAMGYGNNGCYGSACGKVGRNGQQPGGGQVEFHSCLFRDNTTANFRTGTRGSLMKNCVSVYDDPNCRRGGYPHSGSSAPGGGSAFHPVHCPDQRIENCAMHLQYYNCGDSDGIRGVNTWYMNRSMCADVGCYIDGLHITDETRQAAGNLGGAGGILSVSKSGSLSGQNTISQLGSNPTVDVIQGGVPTSPEMAARGDQGDPAKLAPEIGGGDWDGGQSLEDVINLDGENEISFRDSRI